MPTLFSILEDPLKLGIAFSSFCDALLMSYMLVKQRSLSFFLEIGESHTEPCEVKRRLGHHYRVDFGQKCTCVTCKCEHLREEKTMNYFYTNPGVVFSNQFTQMSLNLQVILIIDCLALLQDFMMHYAIKIREHSKHNLDVRPHLASVFRLSVPKCLP